MSQKLEQFMSSVFDAMYENCKIEETVGLVLRQLSDFALSDMAYLIELSGNKGLIKTVFEWNNTEIHTGLGQLEGKHLEPVLADSGKENVTITEISRLPHAMKSIFTEAGVGTLLQCFVCYQGELTGYVGICDFSSEGDRWKNNPAVCSALRYLSRVLSVFLYKSRQEESLKQSELNADTANEILDQISTGVVVLRMPSYDRLFPVYGNLGQYRMLGIERTAVNSQNTSQ